MITEIARALGLKSAARAELKDVLRDLADEGQVERNRRKLARPGHLPSSSLRISGRDSDGGLIATPTE